MEISTPERDRQRSSIRLAPHFVQNKNWARIPSIGPITPGGAQPGFGLASARMVFGEALPIVEPLFVLSTAPATDEGLVTIDDAVAWRLHVPLQPLPLAIGNYVWEIHTTDSAGDVNVYYAGTQLVTA
jgi:hypothetical protein